jgi:multiple sugar transport system substrate-binding protein
MNPRTFLLAGVAGVAAAIAAATAGPASAETDYVAKYGIKKDHPGICSFEAIDAKDYSGHELTILTHAVPVMGEPVALHSKQFEELTGGKVNVVHAPFGELYQKVMIPFQTEQHVYDIVYGGSYWIGDWAPHLEPVPQKYLETAEMQDVTPAYQGVASWNGQRLQYTFDGDRNYFKYVREPFENAEYQAKFKEQYGRDLEVPTTWEEYAEVASATTSPSPTSSRASRPTPRTPTSRAASGSISRR